MTAVAEEIVVDAMRGRCAAIIDRELARLAMRAPGLSSDELATVAAALHQIVGRLMLDQLPAVRRAYPHHIDALLLEDPVS